jgi:hypothetical protein
MMLQLVAKTFVQIVAFCGKVLAPDHPEQCKLLASTKYVWTHGLPVPLMQPSYIIDKICRLNRFNQWSIGQFSFKLSCDQVHTERILKQSKLVLDQMRNDGGKASRSSVDDKEVGGGG